MTNGTDADRAPPRQAKVMRSNLPVDLIACNTAPVAEVVTRQHVSPSRALNYPQVYDCRTTPRSRRRSAGPDDEGVNRDKCMTSLAGVGVSGLVCGGVSRILIADDDPIVRDVVRRYLERDGHEVSIAHDGNEALQLLGTERIDAAVLDVMMPGPDGMTLCRSMRRGDRYAVPVILLTALGEEDDRIAGLEAGADDYVTKPFSPRELALRVRSVLRRAPSTAELPSELSAGSLRVLTAARAVTVDGRAVSLTSREFDLLTFLLTHTDTVYSREELLKLVWQWDFGDLSTVTVHIKRLRSKLVDAHRVQTVWGRGYLWRDEQTSDADQ